MKNKLNKKFRRKRPPVKLLVIILLISIVGFSIFIIISSDNLSKPRLTILNTFAKLKCEEFEENVIWSSGFTHQAKDSTAYYTWKPEHLCKETENRNCFLQEIIVNGRIIYVSGDDKEIDNESYIQISNLDSSNCDFPERGVYSTYMVYATIKGEGEVKNSEYCDYEKEETEDFIKFKSECNLKLTAEFSKDYECFGIKAFAPQFSIIDVFKIKYKLCWENE